MKRKLSRHVWSPRPSLPALAVLLALGAFLALAPRPRAGDPSSRAPAASMSPAPLNMDPRDPRDSRLRPNVDFWVSMYTQYTSRQGVIHDSRYLNHVYEVLDLDKGEGPREAKRKWTQVLLSVHHKQEHPEQMTPDEKKVYDMFRDVNEPNKFLNAANRKRLRFQLGMRDHFLEGLRSSGLYLAKMEEIFRAEGLPVELTRLPFVESGFNLHAYSKVGASGIWQFMRSTGRLYLTIDDALDERNDPLRAAEAAAQLLRQNYESLGTWPLAVTAYNHGRKSMMRAVRRQGTDDLGELIYNYHGRTFGFASANFYCELLAAVEVERNSEKYFGKVERLAPTDFAEAKIPDYIAMKQLVHYLKIDERAVRLLNPALTAAVFEGTQLVPAGYRLRLPYVPDKERKETVGKVFLAGYSEIPGIYKLQNQLPVRYPADSEIGLPAASGSVLRRSRRSAKRSHLRHTEEM